MAVDVVAVVAVIAVRGVMLMGVASNPNQLASCYTASPCPPLACSAACVHTHCIAAKENRIVYAPAWVP